MSPIAEHPVHGKEQAQEVASAKWLNMIFGKNRKARRTRIVNRYFCKKGYRYGIKIKP